MAALLCCPPRRQRGSARCSLAAAARSIQRIPGDPPGLPLRGPDPGFDAREAVTSSNVWAADRWPDLAPFLESGRIVCVRRPEGGLRGEDEPECAVIVCADHASLSLDGGAPSAEVVRRAVEAVRPRHVVVELCRSRASLLQGDDIGNEASTSAPSNNPFSLSGDGGLLGATLRATRLGGRGALLLRVAASLGYRRATDGARAAAAELAPGTDPAAFTVGAEMRAARRAAEALGEGACEVVLGDRPIEITLSRAWRALTTRERFHVVAGLASALAGGSGSTSAAAALAAARAGPDGARAAVVGLAGPALASALGHERDLFLCWSLFRSKAVRANPGAAVVGVVGAAHVPGERNNGGREPHAERRAT